MDPLHQFQRLVIVNKHSFFFISFIFIALNFIDRVGTNPTISPTVETQSLISLSLRRNDYSYSGQNSKSDKIINWEVPEILELNNFCNLDTSTLSLTCNRLHFINDLPISRPEFHHIKHGVFVNISSGSELHFQDLYNAFPQLISVTIVQSPEASKKMLHELWTGQTKKFYNDSPGRKSSSSKYVVNDINIASYSADQSNGFIWPSVTSVNLSDNALESNSLPSSLNKIFPNIIELDLGRNKLENLGNIPSSLVHQLQKIDLSGNPLDCTSEDLAWVDRLNITLLNLEDTVCEHPPHQNRAKPILQTIHLIKKVKAECRVNCSCDIHYIWEQEKVIHSKTTVNCSGKGFKDFPDPEDLPKQTDTLLLQNNQIESLESFVTEKKYADIGIRNLYLDNNKISSLSALETSDWIYTFQVLSLRNNHLSDVPIYLLENIARDNKWLYLIDLSLNDWKCDCRTVSAFKVWLLRYAKFLKNVEGVRCSRTKEEIRYLKNEDWCKQDEVSQMVELLDLLSIFLALLIILIVAKVVYDYWNLKKYGKVPWLISKI